MKRVRDKTPLTVEFSIILIVISLIVLAGYIILDIPEGGVTGGEVVRGVGGGLKSLLLLKFLFK